MKVILKTLYVDDNKRLKSAYSESSLNRNDPKLWSKKIYASVVTTPDKQQELIRRWDSERTY